MPVIAAIATTAFIGTLGVNTHIDFNRYGYENLNTVAQSLQYLGVPNVRDSAQKANTLQTWPQVATAAKVKFLDYMPEGSPANMQNSYNLVAGLAATGVLNGVEGGNEEDNTYATNLGNSLAYTALFQQQVYALGRSLNLPVVNMSFGSGWTAVNNWQGDYGAVGDLSAYTDHGNAHTYPMVGQGVDVTMKRLNGLAKLAAYTRPVMTTEIGWNESQGFAQADVAKYVLNASLDGWKNGNTKTYFYALYDDGSGKFGLMNQDGTAKPAGTALHNLTTLLADTGTTGSTFTPSSLSYKLDGGFGGENHILMQKSDGTYWIAVWDEADKAHPVTLTLDAAAAQVQVFDPLTGSQAIQTVANAAVATLNLTDHPLLVKVVPAPPPPVAAPATQPPAPVTPNVINSFANNSTITGNAGTTAINVYGTGNTVQGGSGTYTLQAFKGSNTVYTGAGTATMSIGGTNNKVFVGSGTNVLNFSGSSSTFVFNKVGVGTLEVFGYILDQTNTLDFRTLLADTQWDGNTATLGNFLKVTNSGSNTIIRVNPSGVAGGATYPVAILHGYAYATLTTVTAHAVLK